MPSISAPVAAIGAGVLGAAGSAISAGSTAAGASAQANATLQAQQAADQTQLQEQANAQKVEAPYVGAGNTAETQQQNLLGLNGSAAATNAMSEFTASPGYQYQLQQGLSAVDNGAAASGMLRSGNTLRAEQSLGDNLASQDFGNYYNRLQALTSVGASAATSTANQAVTTGQGIAQTDTSAGNELGNIYGNEASGIGSSLNSGLNQLATLGNSSGYGPWQNVSSATIPTNDNALSQAPTQTYSGGDI